MKYLFLDTFAMARLTKDHYEDLSRFLLHKEICLVISPLQLIEYYSPILTDGDRTAKAVQLLAKHPFVIVNQNDIYEKEEALYPAILKDLPYRLRSDAVLASLNPEDKNTLLYRMMHEGIIEGEFHLKEWTANHHSTKLDWPERAAAIIKNAEAKYIIKSKAKFVQSLDLRFCLNILDAIEKLSDPTKHDPIFKKYIHKLSGMRERMDNWRLSGIHLSSLIFWYDYVIAKKNIKPSDEGDLLHSMIFPYCEIVVTDNSRVDCLITIQHKETRYLDTRFLRFSEFLKMITPNV